MTQAAPHPQGIPAHLRFVAELEATSPVDWPATSSMVLTRAMVTASALSNAELDTLHDALVRAFTTMSRDMPFDTLRELSTGDPSTARRAYNLGLLTMALQFVSVLSRERSA